MYRGFNLKIDLNSFNSVDRHHLLEKGGRIDHRLNKEINALLSSLTNDGIIDGTGLSDQWFKTIQTDVFISHSHNDEELATIISGWLKNTFNLNVFLDKNVWGSADELLKSIDKIYSSNPDGQYDYTKRNYSTSHVHAMLSTALMKVMDQSEIVIFLNTPESIPTIRQTMQEQSEYTLSPWIYEELVLTTVLRKRHWSEHRKEPLLEFAQESERLLRVKYKAPINYLTPICKSDLNKWYEEYTQAKKRMAGRYGNLFEKNPNHPLNYLYDTVFGILE